MLDTPGGHIAINLLPHQIGNIVFAEVAPVGCYPFRLGSLQVRFQFLNHRLQFLPVVRLLADPSRNNHLPENISYLIQCPKDFE
jgi:hypothetical protein